ncbi:uncharacterized protein LOC131672619 [Phymastichus coffea]|uniref:uncharacterized protein LOC131672619 n=1 Tax=Phymastichus coffea TaxID=108790 RepID=UPI00273AC67E|nr:uncharacterized protein LOC131672619 [Phymastichus coffea]
MFVKTRSNNNEPSKKNFKVKKVSNESDDSEGSSIELDDPCASKEEKEPVVLRSPGLDPRFQQQNQTLRCYVMYADFFQCEHLLGEGHEACKWFKDVYMSICPTAWVEQWDEYRTEGRMPWFKKSEFPKAPYGK